MSSTSPSACSVEPSPSAWETLWGLAMIFLVSRGIVFATFGFLDYIDGDLHLSLSEFVLAHFHCWDATWYAGIAEQGYHLERLGPNAGQSEFAFFPLMPLLARWVAALGDWDVRLVGVALSHVLFAGAMVLFHRFCRRRTADPETATWATALLAFAPQGFVYSFFYTESLFLLLALGVMELLDRKRPIAGGLVGALLTATRPNGLFIGIFFLWNVLREGVLGLRARTSAPTWLNRNAPMLLGGACVPLGLFTYWWFCHRETGDAFLQAHSLAIGWGRESQPPWRNFQELFAEERWHVRFLLGWSFAFLLASFLLLRHRLWPEFLFCVTHFYLYYSGSLEQSLVRYSMLLFPIYLGLALSLPRRTGTLIALLGLFTATNVLLLYAWHTRDILGF